MAETAGVCIKEQSRLCERWVRPELQRISGASSMEEFCLQTGSLRFHTSKNILQELMLHSVSCLSPKTKLSPPPQINLPLLCVLGKYSTLTSPPTCHLCKEWEILP